MLGTRKEKCLCFENIRSGFETKSHFIIETHSPPAADISQFRSSIVSLLQRYFFDFAFLFIIAMSASNLVVPKGSASDLKICLQFPDLFICNRMSISGWTNRLNAIACLMPIQDWLGQWYKYNVLKSRVSSIVQACCAALPLKRVVLGSGSKMWKATPAAPSKHWTQLTYLSSVALLHKLVTGGLEKLRPTFFWDRKFLSSQNPARSPCQIHQMLLWILRVVTPTIDPFRCITIWFRHTFYNVVLSKVVKSLWLSMLCYFRFGNVPI